MSPSEESTQSDSAARTETLATKPDEIDSLVGARLGTFRIDAVIGRGGMGVVYRGFDEALQRPVAIKTMRFDDATARARFLYEARSQAKLRHRNVVPLHVVGEHGGLTYLVMQLVAGETLRALLEKNGKVEERRALQIVDAIAAALEAAQARGLIHRDVKPSNVLVEPDGHVLLTDFGLAKDIHSASGPSSTTSENDDAPPRSLTQAGAILGTPAYLAPEQRHGGHVDHRADMYALGVTAHELLTGVRPSDAAVDLRVFRRETQALVERLLATDPENRYATYAELRAAIADAVGVAVVAAPLASRAAAFVIDFFAVGIVVGVLSSLTAWVARAFLHSDTLKPVSLALAWPFAAVLIGLVEAAYGKTLGKRLLRLRTVDAVDGGRPRLGRSVARSIVKMSPLFGVSLGALVVFPRAYAGFFMFGAAALLALPALGHARRTIHDSIGRTRVVLAIEEQEKLQ
jgi:eukaryotic-like serine/threonine-protein kinase